VEVEVFETGLMNMPVVRGVGQRPPLSLPRVGAWLCGSYTLK